MVRRIAAATRLSALCVVSGVRVVISTARAGNRSSVATSRGCHQGRRAAARSPRRSRRAASRISPQVSAPAPRHDARCPHTPPTREATTRATKPSGQVIARRNSTSARSRSTRGSELRILAQQARRRDLSRSRLTACSIRACCSASRSAPSRGTRFTAGLFRVSRPVDLRIALRGGLRGDLALVEELLDAGAGHRQEVVELLVGGLRPIVTRASRACGLNGSSGSRRLTRRNPPHAAARRGEKARRSDPTT